MPLREGKDNHMGFVDFETEAEVEKAVQLFDGSELGGSTLKVLNPGGGDAGTLFPLIFGPSNFQPPSPIFSAAFYR